MKVLLIDNYDSFVYNIFQSLSALGALVNVVRNDSIGKRALHGLKPDCVVVSPGPGDPSNPRDFGISESAILDLGNEIPVLGVCLGHQGIAAAFGGRVIRAEKPMHGKLSKVRHDSEGLFKGIPNPFQAMRYHSLVVEEASLPKCLSITARAEDDYSIMGLRHVDKPIFGVQFHPESILTAEGRRIFRNFLRMV